jgi:RecA-family ATPase
MREPGSDYDGPRVTPSITQVAKVQSQPVEWLWENRIPMAALTLLDGHPDTGKSTITLDLAARLSTGRRMPDGTRGVEGSTLLLSTEDTLARPVRQRLEAVDANLERIYGLEATDELRPLGGPLVFPEDYLVLKGAILLTDAKLVVIDPIMGHLSHTVNSNADQEVRRALNPLVQVATWTGAAILLVRHLRKPERKKSETPSWLEGGGSSGGFGIVRAGLVTMRDEDDTSLCTLHQTKHNYGQWARPVDYTFEDTAHGVGRLRWLPR